MKLTGLYGIADSGFGSVESQVTQLLLGGVCAVQLRCKTATATEIEALCQSLWPHCQSAGIPLILNDHFLPQCSDGVHLGQSDGDLNEKSRPDGFLFGRSTHNLAQVRAAIRERVDYVGFGPVFPTSTKHTVVPSLGLKALREATGLGIPLVAIGGIQLASLPALQSHGCTAWTAISAIWDSVDPDETIRAFNP
jgi:thiamine-phosphate pyrophosphorylase